MDFQTSAHSGGSFSCTEDPLLCLPWRSRFKTFPEELHGRLGQKPRHRRNSPWDLLYVIGQYAVTLPSPELDWNPGSVIKSLPPPSGASLVSQIVENLPAMCKTQVPSLGQEDPLEKGMPAHFRNLAWRIPRTEDPGKLQSTGSQRVRHD